MGARRAHTPQVTGSSPVSATSESGRLARHCVWGAAMGGSIPPSPTTGTQVSGLAVASSTSLSSPGMARPGGGLAAWVSPHAAQNVSIPSTSENQRWDPDRGHGGGWGGGVSSSTPRTRRRILTRERCSPKSRCNPGCASPTNHLPTHPINLLPGYTPSISTLLSVSFYSLSLLLAAPLILPSPICPALPALPPLPSLPAACSPSPVSRTPCTPTCRPTYPNAPNAPPTAAATPPP